MTEKARCPICETPAVERWTVAEDWEYRTSDGQFEYFRCDVCSVLFLDPVPSDRLQEIYPSNYYSFSGPGKSLLAGIKGWLDGRFFRSILRRLPGPSLRVLDVGGGTGWELGLLRQTDPRIAKTQIVDIDPSAGKVANEHGHSYFCGTIEQYETDDRFDLILLLNIIEHVERPDRVLARIRSLLAPGGIALIKTPNYDALDARIFRHASWAGYHCPRHWVLFTRESFSALATHSGLRTEEFAFTQGAPFWAASVLGALARRKLAKITRERPVVLHPLFPILSAIFALFDFVRRPLFRTSQMFFLLRSNGETS